MVPRGRAVGQPVRFANHSIIAISATVLVLYSYCTRTVVATLNILLYLKVNMPYTSYLYHTVCACTVRARAARANYLSTSGTVCYRSEAREATLLGNKG